jgi:hypothetical protein
LGITICISLGLVEQENNVCLWELEKLMENLRALAQALVATHQILVMFLLMDLK